ncbi:CDP-glycerol glycerophosphotransferase family protein [Romboutsia sp.]|uniref:CDP-glycerol glycerophosphotransferase family protein n=1 Tax=Romboutsia sp. TaxID=1965302 RepID=UPI003F32A98F
MKTLERIVLKYIIKIWYIIFSLLPIKRRIVFATYRMDDIKDNFKFIYNEIKSRNINYECKFLLEKFNPGINGKIKYLIHLIKATYYMATSEYFIIDDFYFPVYVIEPRKGTEIIQVWHACGAFKKFGYSIIDKEYGANNNYIKHIPIHKNYSHVLVSSKEVKSFYAQAFNMSESNISPIGIPRTDIFFDKQIQQKSKEKLYNKYPILKNKKLILYAPTFRGTSQSNAKMDIDFDLDRILDTLDENTIFGLKMHPFVKKLPDLSGYDNVVDLSKYEEINDILLITNLLITDYSSIIFEYSLLEKPIIFFAKDKEIYEKERDFYYDYESLVPGPIVDNTEDLIKIIKTNDFDKDKLVRFKNKFFDYTDGKSSKRFVDKIILKNKS